MGADQGSLGSKRFDGEQRQNNAAAVSRGIISQAMALQAIKLSANPSSPAPPAQALVQETALMASPTTNSPPKKAVALANPLAISNQQPSRSPNQASSQQARPLRAKRHARFDVA
jgi:hypothetical protein